MKGTTYFSWKDGFAVNEGEGPINFCVLFPWGWYGRWFFYLYILGRRWHS